MDAWRRRQLKMARYASKLKRSQRPRKPPTRKPHTPIPRARVIQAIKGTGGLRTLIAKRLGCSSATIPGLLGREGWDDVRAAYQEEIETVGDIAEQTIAEAIQQRMDMSTAARTAQWLLSRARYRERRLMEESKVIHEGGDKPIQVEQTNIPVDVLDLPLDTKRQILEALERREAEKRAHKETGTDARSQ